MQNVKFFKKFLLPCGLCAAVPVAKSLPPSSDIPVNADKQAGKPIRPSELPIYASEPYSLDSTSCHDEPPPGMLEQRIGAIRRMIQGAVREYGSSIDRISTFIRTGRDHSQVLLDYLQEESNVAPKVGAISIGGLTGFIFGLRGGAFKRMIYSSTGALAVASICYPSQARTGYDMGKHYAYIVYNFVYGVKPDDAANKLEIKFPTFNMPSNLSEFYDMISQGSKTVTSNIGSAIGSGIKMIKEKGENDSPKSKQD